MALFGTLVFLVATSVVNSQEYLNHRNKNSSRVDYKNDDIARILQAPLFRNNANLGGLPEYLGYAAQNFDVSEPIESNTETGATAASYQFPAPSSVLLPPKVEALNTFDAHKISPDQMKTFGAYQNVPFPKNEHLEATQDEHSLTPVNYSPKYSRPIPNIETYLPINPLSKQLDLPLANTPNVNFAKISQPSLELQTPLFQPYIPYNSNPQQPLAQYTPQYNVPLNPSDGLYSTQPQTFQDPKGESIKASRVPTKYFPKKYNSNTDEFTSKKLLKSIPVSELADEELVDISKIRKGPKFQKLTISPDESQEASNDENLDNYRKNQESEKQRHKFEMAQKKIQAKKENESKKQQHFIDKNPSRASAANSEPVASESGFNNYHQGLENSFDSPTSQLQADGLSQISHGAGGDRTEFQMHGQHGPHSYKFGYDTGKGKNRQFRFEERDNEGYVKGHYGYYDKHGKLQVVNYDAHPEHGFHAEGSFGKV